jgi:uncharacterized oxidoreductase
MKGEAVPPNSLVDENGLDTNDPSVIFGPNAKGAMQPFGQHKGYGLMVMCELLGGGLGGNFTMQPNNLRQGATLNNMLSIIIDPAAVGDLQAFDDEVTAMIDYIYASTPADGTEKVLIPGDPEQITKAARESRGIDIDDNSWNDVIRSGEAAGLTVGAMNAMHQ